MDRDWSARSPDSPYSWLLASVSAVAMIFTFGTPFSFGIFLDIFSETYDVPRVTLSTVFSTQLFFFYIGAGVVGIFTSRVSSRSVLLASGGLAVVLAPALFVVDSFLGFLVVFTLLGTALGTVFVVLISIVPLWFEKRRGAATGLLFVGNGLSLFVLPPAWQFALDSFGIARGFLVLVALSGASFLLAGIFCRRPPWQDQTTTSLRNLWTWLSSLVTTRQFQLMFVGIGFLWAWYYALSAYAIDLFVERGLTRAGASITFGLIGGISIVSRLGSGIVADRTSYRKTFLVSILASTVGTALLFFPHLSVTFLAVFFLGISLGGISVLYVPVLLEMFDPERDTAIVGVFSIAMGVLAVTFPTITTATLSYVGSYTVVILLTFCSTIVAYVTLWRGTRLQ